MTRSLILHHLSYVRKPSSGQRNGSDREALCGANYRCRVADERTISSPMSYLCRNIFISQRKHFCRVSSPAGMPAFQMFWSQLPGFGQETTSKMLFA
jgi:hypothetical protein